MKKIFLIILILIGVTGCSSTKVQPVNLSTGPVRAGSPEEVIYEYYSALREGDANKINNLFIRNETLIIDPSPTISYRIASGRQISNEEAVKRNYNLSRSELRGGDLEVFVEEYINKSKEDITFILRKVDGRWYIYGHSIGYYI